MFGSIAQSSNILELFFLMSNIYHITTHRFLDYV